MELWVVVTNARSWGKGETFNEATSNAFKEAGQHAVTHYLTKMTVVKFDDVTEDQRSKIGVNEIDGGVFYPNDLKPRTLIGADVPLALRNAWSAWDLEIEDIEQRPNFYGVFDD